MRSLAALALAALFAGPLTAQGTPPRFGIDGGLLYATVDGSDFARLDAGVGFQVQGRLILRGFSVGAGFVRTSHGVESITENLVITGFLLEPRYTFPTTGTLHPFLVARLGRLNQSLKANVPGFGTVDGEGPGNVFGAGGGVAFALAPQVELNVAATYNKLTFGDVTVNGSKDSDSATNGSSVTLQVGLAYVFGKAQAASRLR